MTMTTTNINALGLRDGPRWGSFEDLRLKPAENLAKVQPGTVGTLQVKSRSYRILDESDYRRLEHMHDALSELEAIRQQLDLVFEVVEFAHEANKDDRALTMIDKATESVKRTIETFTHRYAAVVGPVRAG